MPVRTGLVYFIGRRTGVFVGGLVITMSCVVFWSTSITKGNIHTFHNFGSDFFTVLKLACSIELKGTGVISVVDIKGSYRLARTLMRGIQISKSVSSTNSLIAASTVATSSSLKGMLTRFTSGVLV